MTTRKIILSLCFVVSLVGADEQSFKEFTTQNYFAQIKNDALSLRVVCRKSYDDDDKKKYYELIFYNGKKNVFDLNKHFRAYQVGHRNLKTPFYSFTVWNWFQALAIKSKKETFITTTEQNTMRRSEIIPPELVSAIIYSAQFDIFFHYLKDNTKSTGSFKVSNPNVLRKCFL